MANANAKDFTKAINTFAKDMTWTDAGKALGCHRSTVQRWADGTQRPKDASAILQTIGNASTPSTPPPASTQPSISTPTQLTLPGTDESPSTDFIRNAFIEFGPFDLPGDLERGIDELIEFGMTEDLCFTSKEIVHVIRTLHPELKFTQRTAGRIVRDAMRNSSYTPVSRMTAGIGKTPAGQEVIVYGPNRDAAIEYDFEF